MSGSFTLTARLNITPPQKQATVTANGTEPARRRHKSYLTGLWARIRAKLHREEIRIFGIRVARPHHDGTPHWHMLMFMLPEDVERVRLIIRDYAWDEDHHELEKRQSQKGAAFMPEAIDPEKAARYRLCC